MEIEKIFGGLPPSVKLAILTDLNSLNTKIGAIEDMAPAHIEDSIDCSTEPNFPSSTAGDVLVVTVAGKIGGAAGDAVEAGDLVYCKETNTGGTKVQVGTKFIIVQKNIDGAVTSSAASATDTALPVFDGVSGKVIKASLVTVDEDGSINLPAGQKVTINNVDPLDSKVDKVEGSSLATTEEKNLWNGNYVQQNKALSGDMVVVISPATIDRPVAQAGTPYSREILISLNDAAANLHSWFNGKLPIAVVENSENGLVAFDGADPIADGKVQFTNGQATVHVNCTGTWVQGDTNTVTVGDTSSLLGYPVANKTSVETITE